MTDAVGVVRRLLPYTTVAVVLAAAYAGWTMYSRHRDTVAMERAAQASEADADRKVVEQYGDGAMKILALYGSPPTVRAGQKALLCYGVVNAKSVSIDPLPSTVWPAVSRCLEIHPERTTRYTMTAMDAAGHSVSQSTEVQVAVQ